MAEKSTVEPILVIPKSELLTMKKQQISEKEARKAFIRAFYKIKKYDMNKAFYPWFYKLLKNLCMDYLRRRHIKSDIPIEKMSVFEDTNKNLELTNELWKGIEKLPFAQREVIILKYFHQYSYKEIAQVLQKPEGTIMSSLYYAKKKLNEILSPYLGIESSDYPEK
ncbi:MAG TPA: RNA polymerase sigma factor [Acidobacteriota bacterium]|nr:RNA polymerase sigma factor [Acidobacteriota bacterium]